MATTSTIGTSSRNYSTIASWLAAFATGGWIGECYNDSEFTAGCNFTGHSTSATDYIELRTASGQSYRDNASVQTNAFAYNQSNGVGVKQNTGYAEVFYIQEDYITIKWLQIAQINAGGGYPIRNETFGTANCVLDSLIMEQGSTGVNLGRMRQGLLRNCLGILRTSVKDGWDNNYGSATFANCTMVRPSDLTAGGNAFPNSTGVTIKNCAVFGFTTFSSGSPSGSNNSSDVTIGFGTSNQASKTYANQFVTTTDTGRDFKVKNSSADLYNNGATDTTNIPAAIDAVGTSRPQSTSWDIGAWELVASSPVTTRSNFTLMGVG